MKFRFRFLNLEKESKNDVLILSKKGFKQNNLFLFITILDGLRPSKGLFKWWYSSKE